MRSTLSSQVCGYLDYIVGIIGFSLFHLTVWLSTCLGAFIGGIANYIVNYRFTFHASGMGVSVTLTKFLFIWGGSLLLNSFGTEYVYKLAMHFDIVDRISWVGRDGVFVVARLAVALIVSVAWNFCLQRNFVFTDSKLDPLIERTLKKIGISDAKPHK